MTLALGVCYGPGAFLAIYARAVPAPVLLTLIGALITIGTFMFPAVVLTTTTSVGTVRDAMIAWAVKRERSFELSLPVVAETYDGLLNDIDGFHVGEEHVFMALVGAS